MAKLGFNSRFSFEGQAASAAEEQEPLLADESQAEEVLPSPRANGANETSGLNGLNGLVRMHAERTANDLPVYITIHG